MSHEHGTYPADTACCQGAQAGERGFGGCDDFLLDFFCGGE